jgi:hypothetical protein
MLTGYMVGSLASLATDEGNTAEALALCDTVEQQLRPQYTPTARVWSTALKAAALAGAGQRPPALRLLGDAEEMVEHSTAEGGMAWPWLYPFSADKLAATKAVCELKLGQPAAAKSALVIALNSPILSGRQRGGLLIDLSLACLQLEEVDESCNALSRALDVAVHRQSQRLLHRIHLARHELDQWRGAPPVRELDDRLHSYPV